MNKKILKYLILIFFVFLATLTIDVNAAFYCDGNDGISHNASFKSYEEAGSIVCDYPEKDMNFNYMRDVVGRIGTNGLQMCIGYTQYEWMAGDPTNYTFSNVSSYSSKVKNANEKDVYICPIVYMGLFGEWNIGDQKYKNDSSFKEAEPYWHNVPGPGTEADALLCLGTEKNYEQLEIWIELVDIWNEMLELNVSISNQTIKQPTYDITNESGSIIKHRFENICENSVYEQIKTTPGYNPEKFSLVLSEAIADLQDNSFSFEDDDKLSIDYNGARYTYKWGDINKYMSKIVNEYDIYGNDMRMTCNANCGTVTTTYCNSDNYKKIDKFYEMTKTLETATTNQTELIGKCTGILQLVDVDKYNEISDDVNDFINEENDKAAQMDRIVTDKIKDITVLGSDTEIKDCESLLDDDLQKVLKWALAVVRIGAPIILIVMITVDFGQAVISQDQEAVKKATSKAVKRVIAAIALFFIPYIVELLLDMIGITNGNCGL